jgi:hypothetical protein
MKAIALDANLLLLLVIGTATGKVVGKRLKSFTEDDLGLLLDCIAPCDKLVTTPNVWTEVSNLWDFGIEGEWLRSIPQTMALMIKMYTEVSIPSAQVADDPDFVGLGLADCAWLKILDQETTLLTVDVPLFEIALSRGLKAVNFTHLRKFD